MRKLVIAALFAVVLVAPHAQAAKYGAAGCGLGSMIFGAQPGIVQIFAATTNGTFASQTFGITTGTSNCDGGVVGTAGTKVFIEANKEALAKDISRGSGETLANLSTLAGCSDAKAVGATLQKNFNAIFPNASIPAEAVSNSIVSTLKAEPVLACSKLG